MRLFLAKHDCESAAVVIAEDWPAAVELFTTAVHAWTTDKWEREDWPREFGRERGAGIDVPEMQPVVAGTYFARDGWEMVFRGGEWVRTGHDFYGRALRENLAGIEAGRLQREAAAAAELAAVRGEVSQRGTPVCQHRECAANVCDVGMKRSLDAICADTGSHHNVG